MKQPFEVGDRVSIKGPGVILNSLEWTVRFMWLEGMKGTVETVLQFGYIRVSVDDIAYISGRSGFNREIVKEWVYEVHECQCTRLVRKKRRSVWVKYDDNIGWDVCEIPCDGYAEFREVVKGKE